MKVLELNDYCILVHLEIQDEEYLNSKEWIFIYISVVFQMVGKELPSNTFIPWFWFVL